MEEVVREHVARRTQFNSQRTVPVPLTFHSFWSSHSTTMRISTSRRYFIPP